MELSLDFAAPRAPGGGEASALAARALAAAMPSLALAPVGEGGAHCMRAFISPFYSLPEAQQRRLQRELLLAAVASGGVDAWAGTAEVRVRPRLWAGAGAGAAAPWQRVVIEL